MHEVLQDLVNQSVTAGNPGVILEVDAPTRGFHQQFSSGVFNLKTGEPLRTTDGFRIASMSKTLTATLVLQLMEEGQLELDAPFSDYLDITLPHGQDLSKLTIKMLLHHNAGLWDFAMSQAWGKSVWSDPGRFHKPQETLNWALTNGELIGNPGTSYHYSDTGYLILGMLLEAVTHQSWGDLCRNRILVPVGMSQTWLEGYESPRSTLSHCYVDEMDGLDINGSVDWAAGGHVSTSADLRDFVQAVFHGQLFRHLATLDIMLSGFDCGDGTAYGAGVKIRRSGKQILWGHSGFWGSFMFYIPGERITVTGTQNRVGANAAAFVDAVVLAIEGLI